ncbi:GNAT family N-acetyltransferase [Helcococcus sueciensis]|uniref:GNAT family N-acetyltransferase n=1 Tax=Helcococcus sueciensis TaxID=241555 RepID=UPI00040122BE|nr:GNAT family protein [Helcococcus sueciensis]
MLNQDNLVLRPILRSDLEKLNKWKNDEEIFMFLGGGFNPQSIDQQALWIDKIINIDDKNKRFIIEVDSEAIGLIGLYNIHNIYQNCEIGMYIGEKDFQGKGYAKDACNLIEKYAFEYLNMRKIKIFVVDDNSKALKFWRKLGYKIVGTLEEERYIKGQFRDLVIMEKFLQK